MNQDISYRNIFRIAWPLLISYLGHNIILVTDTAFLGRLGEAELGAVGNAGLFYMMFVLIGMGFSNGLQIIIGRRNGEKDYKAIGKLMQQGAYILLPITLFCFVLLQYFAPSFLALFVKSNLILEHITAYISTRSFGLAFTYLNLLLVAFFVGTTNTRVITASTLAVTIVNVFLDYSLIFGHFGLPDMGVKGAALASVIADFSGVMILLGFLLFRVQHKTYEIFNWVYPQIDRIKRILDLSGPIMLQSFIAFGSWFIFFSLIEQLGERQLAISHIIRSIFMVMMLPIYAITNTTNTLVSNLIGQNENGKVLELIYKCVKLAFICNVVITTLSFIFPKQIIGVFTEDKMLITDSVNTLFVTNIAMYFLAVSMVLFSGISGTGNTRKTLFIEVMAVIGYLITATTTVFILKTPLEYVWCSEIIYFLILGIFSYNYLKSKIWQGKII